MKNLNTKMMCKVLLCLSFMLFVAFPGNAAEIDEGLAMCAAIKDDNDARLKCFDNLAEQNIPVKDTLPTSADIKPAQQEASAESDKTSIMSKQWDLYPDSKKERSAFVLKSYRPNYFLPVAYNSSPNEDAPLEFDPHAKAQHNEAKFQISFKVKPWGTDIENMGIIKGMDLWLAYTQLAFWQLYNSAFSSPFRETNYEPEFLVNLRTDYKILGFDGRFLNIGFNHQSNGRSVPLSRSWNRIVANVGLERDNFNLLLKTWYRLPEDQSNDDNPDISRYMGYGELWGTLYWKKQRFALMLRNNFRQENLGAVQLDWSFPLPWIGDKLSIYLQYFNGYGESLLDYNKSINRISAGFMLVDWN
jgi:phospholipase A1